MDYTVHGILQARILEWVAFPFSRGSFQPKNQRAKDIFKNLILTLLSFGMLQSMGSRRVWHNLVTERWFTWWGPGTWNWQLWKLETPAQAPHWLLKEWRAAGRAERLSGTAQVNQEAANSSPPVQGFQAGKQTNSLHIYIPFLPYFLNSLSKSIFISYWSTGDSQCHVSFSCTAEWICYKHPSIHSFLDSFPM